MTVPMNACSKSLPLLLCDHVRFEVTTYYSNIPPAGAYQGYGAPQGSYAVQMACAELAGELGMDVLALLEKNRVREGVMLEIMRCLGEGREGIASLVESCGLGPALEQGAALIEWGVPVASDDPDLKIGKGVAMIQQGSGLPGIDSSNATITLLGDGTFMLLSGGTDGGEVKRVAEMAELLAAADPRARLGAGYELPVIYAGNRGAADIVRGTLGESTALTVVDNLRPTLEREHLQPARDAIHELFMEHVMAHAPGYRKLTTHRVRDGCDARISFPITSMMNTPPGRMLARTLRSA